MKRSITDAYILFPAIAVVGLAVTWGTALNVIESERTGAERTAIATTRALAATYEAQVVRALREIDQTLKVVKYAYEQRDQRSVLQELKSRVLLPPDMLFVVSIADAKGDIVAGTRPSAKLNVADQHYFQNQRESDVLTFGRPRQSPDTGEWKLQFSRRLNAPDGKFAGIAIVAVDAAHFVSGYEPSKMGEHGTLGILGTDGVFRARRTGEAVSAGDSVDYMVVVPASDEAQAEVRLTANPWDGVERYTSARQLYEFPLAVIVGLSVDEQLAASRRDMRTHLWRAGAGSFVLLLIVAVLGRMSRQLTTSRRLVAEEQIDHAARVEYLAYHDGLTALPNRRLFNRLLTQAIEEAQRGNSHLAVLFLDLDGFKSVNDTLGHEAGDRLLQEVAKRLKDCLRDGDAVARLGGDEFVAILPQLDEEKYAATVAQKILTTVARPFDLLGLEVRVTASVGISIYPEDGQDERTLKKNADAAMYQAKEDGKNNFQFYSRTLNAGSLERVALESGLRHALERNELALHYQAKREIGSGRITGMEALLRWNHPPKGMVAPGQFIPVAEESGLIVPIGKWVLRTACAQCVEWRTQGLPPVSMAVNLTARQFSDDNLLADLGTILAQTGMEAHRLELEITESLLMRDVDKALRVLTNLRDMGIRIAIDDFGAGYSALSALRHFPLDTIKIDRSFIRDVTNAPGTTILTAESIIAMGRTLSRTVVAVGVETKEQADVLRRNAFDEFQGFYLDRPVPAEQIVQLLRAQAGLKAA